MRQAAICASPRTLGRRGRQLRASRCSVQVVFKRRAVARRRGACLDAVPSLREQRRQSVLRPIERSSGTIGDGHQRQRAPRAQSRSHQTRAFPDAQFLASIGSALRAQRRSLFKASLVRAAPSSSSGLRGPWPSGQPCQRSRRAGHRLWLRTALGHKHQPSATRPALGATTLRPNTSLKLTPSGVPRWPRNRVVYHRPRGQRVTPLGAT